MINRNISKWWLGFGTAVMLIAAALNGAETGAPTLNEHLKVRLSWGHQSSTAQPYRIGFGANNVVVTQITPDGYESGDVFRDGAAETRAGAGDVDAITAEVSWQKPSQPPRKPHEIWAYLLQHGTPDQIARLKDDPGLQPDAPVLTVLTAADGTRGFSIGLEQLARHKAMWLPEHDVFVTLADAPVDFAAHLASLEGERVLHRVKRGPEATLDEWMNKWEDIGNPIQWHKPWETSWLGTKGHLTGAIARHGSRSTSLAWIAGPVCDRIMPRRISSVLISCGLTAIGPGNAS